MFFSFVITWDPNKWSAGGSGGGGSKLKLLGGGKGGCSGGTKHCELWNGDGRGGGSSCGGKNEGGGEDCGEVVVVINYCFS